MDFSVNCAVCGWAVHTFCVNVHVGKKVSFQFCSTPFKQRCTNNDVFVHEIHPSCVIC